MARKNNALNSGLLALALVAGAAGDRPRAQDAAQTLVQTLVIDGGTLIDATGRAPVTDSVIVISGNRFVAVGKRGEVSVPQGARVYDARGKTILPGFIDGHCHLEHFWGEVTCISA